MKIKFCGFTRIEDVKFAIELGVDFQGFIFFSGSKRFVSLDRFEMISKGVKGGRFVGVFVNEESSKVIEVVKRFSLAFAQLHGDESDEDVFKLIKEGVSAIKAFRVRGEDDVFRVRSSSAEYVLLDAFVEGIYGGTGKSIDFALVDSVLSRVRGKKIFLAGGIGSENIESVMRNFGKYLYALDISSGIEESPGIKSSVLMREVYCKFDSLRQVVGK